MSSSAPTQRPEHDASSAGESALALTEHRALARLCRAVVHAGRRAAFAGLLVALPAGAVWSAAPPHAQARRTSDLGYRYDQVWTAAVRLVRVDYGFRVVERDAELGFVMFEYVEGNQTFNGSIEVLRRTDTLNRERVRVVVHIQGQPMYVERMVMERLERKLRGDYGRPPPDVPVVRAEREAPAADGDGVDGEATEGAEEADE